MPNYTDQLGREVKLAKAPRRIVSTVPSQTELLYDLGLTDEVVGITAYCVHPKSWLQDKTVIGGTKDLQIEKIKSLKPDLIIGNKEENVREQIEELAREIPVWLSDVVTVGEALDMIEGVGKVCERQQQAADLLLRIKTQREQLKAIKKQNLRAAYFIWKEPYMMAGPETFINSMMQECGFQNVVPPSSERYPAYDLKKLKSLKPQLILLSSEPYSFRTADLHNIGETFPDAQVKIVDGELYSWYGSRIMTSLQYFIRFSNI